MGMKCIGVDVGGTSVKIGLFEITGELLDKWEVRTRKEEGGRYILPDVARSIRDKMEEMGLSLKTDLAGIGLGVPGPVMPDGFVEVCVNLGWRRMNPQEELSSLLDGVTVKSGNDANVAALGEMWQGGGKGYPEDEDMAGHRVIFQHRLHLCGETIEAVAHVGDTGNQPDFGACWQVVITSFICPVMILMTSPDYFTTHMGLPDTGSGWISASTLNTVFRSSGFITASGAPCAITRPLASTTR